MPYTIFYTNLSTLNIREPHKFLSGIPYQTMCMLERGEKEENSVEPEERGGILHKYQMKCGKAGDGVDPVYGIHTNEAALKSILNQEIVDELILIASSAVFENSRYEKELTKKRNKGAVVIKNDDMKNPAGEWYGTLDYFLNEIRDYCIAKFGEREGRDRIKAISVYPIDDSPEARTMTNCAISVARKIISIRSKYRNDEDLRIILDSNGGKREFIIIQLGIIRALEARGIKPTQILYSDFNRSLPNWGEEAIEIQEKKDSYKIFDVVSGVDEFIEYGRAYKLKEYFTDSRSCIGEVLDSINRMSEAFTTCFTDPIVDSVVAAAGAVLKFEDDSKSPEGLEQTRLEKQVVEQIREDLGEDLICLAGKRSGQTDEMIFPLIRWCYRKKFYQQAITLYVDRMPAWYAAAGILVPGSGEDAINTPEGFYANLYRVDSIRGTDEQDLYKQRIDMIARSVDEAGNRKKRDAAISELRKLKQDPKISLLENAVDWKIKEIKQNYEPDGNRKESADKSLGKTLKSYFSSLSMKYREMTGQEATGEKDKSEVYIKKMTFVKKQLTEEFADSRVSLSNVNRLEALRRISEYYLGFKICRNNSNHSNGVCGSNEKEVFLWLEQEGIVKLNNGQIRTDSITLDFAVMNSLLENALRYHQQLLSECR